MTIQASLLSPPRHDVLSAIQKASASVGVDFNYMLGKAQTESSLNPNAKAKTSSAAGLYQFIEQTWLTMVNRYGAKHGMTQEADAIDVRHGRAIITDPAIKKEILAKRFDPETAALMAAEFAAENQRNLQASVRGPIGGTELYLAHFLGAGGAAQFLQAKAQNPQQAAADILPQAAAANKNVFYKPDGTKRSVAEIYARFDNKMHEQGDVPTKAQLAQVKLPAALNTQLLAQEQTPLSAVQMTYAIPSAIRDLPQASQNYATMLMHMLTGQNSNSLGDVELSLLSRDDERLQEPKENYH